MPGVKQPCPTVAACWSPATPRIRIGAAEQIGRGRAEVAGAVAHLRQQRRRHAEQLAQVRVPASAADVEQQRARRIGRIGGVHACRRSAATAGSCRSCRTRACPAPPPPARRRRGRAARRFWWPRNTDRAAARCARDISGSWPCWRSAAQASAVRRSCQTMALWIGLPVARSQTTVVSRWLVMPIAAMPRGVGAGLRHGVAHGRDRRRPDFLRIVLDLSRPRIDLAEFLLRGRDRLERGIEHDGARRGGALIDCEEILSQGARPEGLKRRLPYSKSSDRVSSHLPIE